MFEDLFATQSNLMLQIEAEEFENSKIGEKDSPMATTKCLFPLQWQSILK